MRPIRVVKLGGSLFDLNDLPQRLNRWLSAGTPQATILLSGGGPYVDTLRSWNERHTIPDDVAHRMALEFMGLTLQLIADWLPGWRRFECLEELRRWSHQGQGDPLGALFDCRRFVLDHAELPASWDVTSDSIAAAVAVAVGADELVLLKSTNADACTTRADLISHGIVDRAFASWANRVRHLRVVNLRDEPPTVWTDTPQPTRL